MCTDHEDTGEAVVALVGGILIGFAATLLYTRMQRNRAIRRREDDDYAYDGGDLFV